MRDSPYCRVGDRRDPSSTSAAWYDRDRGRSVRQAVEEYLDVAASAGAQTVKDGKIAKTDHLEHWLSALGQRLAK